jgi:hypothetical protein
MLISAPAGPLINIGGGSAGITIGVSTIFTTLNSGLAGRLRGTPNPVGGTCLWFPKIRSERIRAMKLAGIVSKRKDLGLSLRPEQKLTQNEESCDGALVPKRAR